MLGRAAYADPYLLAEVDGALFGAREVPPSRLEVLDRFVPYVEAELSRGSRLNSMTRHILGLFHGQPRARAFRRHLAENAHRDGAGLEVLNGRARHRRGRLGRASERGRGRVGVAAATYPAWRDGRLRSKRAISSGRSMKRAVRAQ